MEVAYDDDQLVSRLQNGDRSAFEAIYRRYVATLLSFTRKTIHDSEECREIVQDIFESLWRRRSEQKITSLKAYLFRAARNGMIDYFRKAQLVREYAEHFTLFESAYESSTDEERSEDAIREKLLRAIEGLADRCRMALNLRIRENLSNSEIAERMNITKGTVELYMVKAVKQLRAQFHIEDSR
jgi:RNA polymerase sigma-70 factor (ECF subfamily)